MAKQGDELYRVMVRQKILSTPGMVEKTYTNAVSYIAPGQPPVTLFIPEKDWTEKKERELILKDIEERKKIRPEVVRR